MAGRRGGKPPRRSGLSRNPGRFDPPPPMPPKPTGGRRPLGTGPTPPTPPTPPSPPAASAQPAAPAPPPRRPLGFGPPPRQDQRREPLTGAYPYSRYEAAAFRNVIAPNRPSQPIDTQPPEYTQRQVQEYVDRASGRLGPDKVEALRRAFLGDTDALLTERPTNTSDSTRPRTLAAGYDAQSKTMFVRFRGRRTGPESFEDGVGYEYYNVTRAEWRDFRDNWSPGRRINAIFNSKPYTPAGW